MYPCIPFFWTVVDPAIPTGEVQDIGAGLQHHDVLRQHTVQKDLFCILGHPKAPQKPWHDKILHVAQWIRGILCNYNCIYLYSFIYL